MTDIKIKLEHAQATAELTGILTSGMVGVTVRFEFGPVWDGLIKNAVFHGSGAKIVETLLRTTETTVPYEVLLTAGTTLRIGVEGRSSTGELVIPSTMVDVGVVQPGTDPFGDQAMDPTQPAWAEVMAAVEELAETAMDAEAVSALIETHNTDTAAHTDIRDGLLALDGSKVNVSDIVNDLYTTDTEKPLSANMGATLKKDIDIAVADMTESLAKCVRTVNGVSPDETGNVEVAGGSGTAAAVTVIGIGPSQSESGAAVDGSADHNAAQIKALADSGTVPLLCCDAVYYEYSHSSTAALASFYRIEILKNYIKKHYCYINASGVLTQYTTKYDPTIEDIPEGADGQDGLSVYPCTAVFSASGLAAEPDDGSAVYCAVSDITIPSDRTLQVGDLLIDATGNLARVDAFANNDTVAVTILMSIIGEKGYTPVRGTDYWTEADKAEIKAYVDEAILGGAW